MTSNVLDTFPVFSIPVFEKTVKIKLIRVSEYLFFGILDSIIVFWYRLLCIIEYFSEPWIMKNWNAVVTDPAFFLLTDLYSSTMKKIWSILTFFSVLTLFLFFDNFPVLLGHFSRASEFKCFTFGFRFGKTFRSSEILMLRCCSPFPKSDMPFFAGIRNIGGRCWRNSTLVFVLNSCVDYASCDSISVGNFYSTWDIVPL